MCRRVFASPFIPEGHLRCSSLEWGDRGESGPGGDGKESEREGEDKPVQRMRAERRTGDGER